MKYFTLIVLFVLFSCGYKEDILLPKSDVTVVADVQDHSPIYIFFRTKDKDTLAEVNRKNSIISTNWILNIDKRLPLRLVVPQVIKLQQKKREEKAHKNEKAENYYSYADSIGKNLAFIPFTNVYYKMKKPTAAVIYFNKNNEVLIENAIVKKEKVKEVLIQILSREQANDFSFGFHRNLSFGSYLQNKIFIESLHLDFKSKEEFIY
ncbi:hypothetical protein SAMN05444395_107140 [Flavobacterium fryxellicola]|uniref:Lipoprotein n=1 Tax=Flavobacterium fryxellicola TaxID=249352 RepID=A0A167YTN4_9FLAO|nr:hypothetical protein [Flavobacterium fryxellicola]OAB29774.1 hypothetical protein FBFR_03370 [Flavobacterium fryxellicola]SHN72934.1 hypothetical protein SAMN05444395_107140 [Flavobacterium fryxellicola]